MVPNSETRFLSSIMKPGLSGNVALIGFPWDLGYQRSTGKTLATGLDNGPDSFRRFLSSVGPVKNGEFGVDLTDIMVSDYGNIMIEGSHTLETLLEKLTAKCLSVLNKGNVSVTIGGSSDCGLGALRAAMQFRKEKQRVGILKVSNLIDSKPEFDANKVTNENMMRIFAGQEKLSIDAGFVEAVYFGVEQGKVSSLDKEFLDRNEHFISMVSLREIRKGWSINHEIKEEMKENKEKGDTIGENKEIRGKGKENASNEITEPITQAGLEFQRLLKKMSNKCDIIHVSIKLEALNAAYCPGVCNPSVLGGLTAEEMKEIVLVSGMEEKVRSVDFSDYNPKFEDYRTGLLLAGLLYYLIMGFKLRSLSFYN